MFTEYIKTFETVNENYQVVMDLIKENDEIVILRHVRPDPDALGAQIGLKYAIENMYPEKTVYALGEDEPSLSMFDQMNITSTAQQPLVIVVDTANVERIDGDISNSTKVVKIDHHPNREPFGGINIVETGVSSTSELIYALITLWGEDEMMSDDVAKNLYLGIVGDTGRFLFDNTSSLTHYTASKLKAYDFNASKLMQEMNQTAEEEFRFKGYLIDNYVLRPSGLLYVYVSEEALKTYGISANVASLNVNMFRELSEVKVWFMALEEDGKLRVRLRSKEIVINDIAEQFGGGGHPLASGVRIGSKERLELLIEAIEKKL